MGYSNSSTAPKKCVKKRNEVGQNNALWNFFSERSHRRGKIKPQLYTDKEELLVDDTKLQGVSTITGKHDLQGVRCHSLKTALENHHKNYLDHVYAVSDDDGDLLEHYRYTAFGEVTIYNATGIQQTTTQINNQILWNTRRRDSVSGYYMYKFRHYSAELGRWLGRDPIEEDGGENLYGFVGNQPLRYWDYLGHEKSRELCRLQCKWSKPAKLEFCITRCMAESRGLSPTAAKFLAWYEEEKKNLAWNDILPACPCDIGCFKTKCTTSGDPTLGPGTSIKYERYFTFCNPDNATWSNPENPNFWGNYHPGAKVCIRTIANGTGEQCCYGSNGKLLTSGLGAGSADKRSPNNGIWDNLFTDIGHNTQDVEPFGWAQELDGKGKLGEYTKKYYEVRKANNKNKCPNNPSK